MLLRQIEKRNRMELDRLNNKAILIWGYGREGKSTEAFLRTHTSGCIIEIFEGKREDIDDSRFDYIFKSPGIVMEEENPKFTSQTELFLECFRDRVIGVTGTKGKSTTSSMLYYVLNACLPQRVILLGNIGLPCLDYFDEIDEDTIVVFEMSCHQLAHVGVSPHIAVFLNLFEEHLDYYGTVEKYFAAKANITRFQTKNDFLFIGSQVPPVESIAQRTSISREEVPDYALKVLGEHNDYNAHFVFRIATELFGVDENAAKQALGDFTGLPHRLQYLGKKDGVDYYDDSISTIPNATIEALRSIPNAVSVIIGGMDRGICYDSLINFIHSNRQYLYIFAYSSGKRIYESVSEELNCKYVEDLAAAVDLAKRVTPEGGACVLSPAAASYGYFKNFEERGDAFRALVGIE